MKCPGYFKRLFNRVRIAWNHRQIIERQNQIIVEFNQHLRGHAVGKTAQQLAEKCAQQLEVINAFYKRARDAEKRMFILMAQFKRSLEGKN